MLKCGSKLSHNHSSPKDPADRLNIAMPIKQQKIFITFITKSPHPVFITPLSLTRLYIKFNPLKALFLGWIHKVQTNVMESTQDKNEDKSPESRNYKNITTQIISGHQKSEFLESITLSKIYQTINSKYTTHKHI